MNNLDLVILAGGKGSRIKKFLKNKPKPMAKFNNKYFIEYIIQNFSKYDFRKIYILAGYKSKIIINKFHKKIFNFVEVICLKEKNLMGTGGALNVLKKEKINDFILVNGDTIFDINLNLLLNTIKNNQVGSIALIKNSSKKNYKLNKLSINKNKIINETKGNLKNAGVYFFKKKILNFINNKVSSLENDILPKLIKKRLLSGKIFNSFFLDIGTPNNYKKANNLLYKNFYKPAVFLDRDGVINYKKNYVYKKKDFKFRPGVIKGLKLLNQKGYYIFIITNQAGIGKNIFKENDFFNLHTYIKAKLQKLNIFINNVSYSPYHPKAKIKKYKKNSLTRKPGNLMVEKIKKEWHIDLKRSFMIGDQISDQLCAKKSKLYFQFAKKNFHSQIKSIIRSNNY
jgi:D-glycero-D-manno-heptose 1,7-bisphosphate phosphatase